VTAKARCREGGAQAEEYHQDYTRLNPDQPYIVQCSLPKVRKVRELFKDRLKPSTQPSK
jgi:peptide-methionine (S)-S-oxide reductase